MGSYGFNWLHDEQMDGDDSPLLQNLRSDFGLRYYSRGITMHHTKGYRSHPKPDGGYEHLPARIFHGNQPKPSRGFVYDLRPY